MFLIGILGWRWTLVAAGCFGFALVLAAAASVLNELRFRGVQARSDEAGAPRAQPRARSRSGSRKYFGLSAPLFVAMPMTITAAVFHQALIADTVGVSLQWFAVSFVAFAISRVLISLLIGPIVDRVGSSGLFCAHLLPLAAGTIALITLEHPAIVPVYWFCAGVTSGLGTVLQTTAVADRVAPARLATARSLLGAATIVASALGPSCYGLALAAGAGMPAVLWFSVAALLAATLAGLFAHKSAALAPHDRDAGAVTSIDS